jgi:hypothetical protein
MTRGSPTGPSGNLSLHVLQAILRLTRFVVFWVVVPLMRALLRLVPEGDRWERLTIDVPLAYHGAAGAHDFTDYLGGASGVPAASLEDIETWLRGCTYEPDPNRPDDWRWLPSEFEAHKSGNCLDHALWAWRKLLDLGYQAELVVGRDGAWAPVASRHAWVVFERGGRRYILDATVKSEGSAMVRPATDGDDGYWPDFGVGASGERFVYGGYWRTLRAQVDAWWASRTKRSAPAA